MPLFARASQAGDDLAGPAHLTGVELVVELGAALVGETQRLLVGGHSVKA